MRIAVVTKYLHRVGGIETYLEWVLPELTARGHQVAVWHEYALEPGGERLVPASIPSYELGAGHEHLATHKKPDVVFLHGLSSPTLETPWASVAPLVVFLHAYNGTCVSGTKTYAFPSPEPCSRTLGPGCLLRYYPRRCGGWSPVTMVRSYQQQQQRRALLLACARVTTLSAHMREECIAQGVGADRVVHLPAFTPVVEEELPRCTTSGYAVPGSTAHVTAIRPRSSATQRATHLVFAGRMERLKGGQVLLDALDRLPSNLRTNLRVTFAGDGRERGRWEQQAARVSRGEFDIRFVGWLSPGERSALFAEADLLVLPSIWPEPLGLVGLEAAAAGLPAVAFDLGGIGEWLTDGVTGRLVAASPGGSGALATALEECLKAPALLTSWGMEAQAQSRRRTLAAHVDELERVLYEAAGRPQPAEQTRDLSVQRFA